MPLCGPRLGEKTITEVCARAFVPLGSFSQLRGAASGWMRRISVTCASPRACHGSARERRPRRAVRLCHSRCRQCDGKLRAPGCIHFGLLIVADLLEHDRGKLAFIAGGYGVLRCPLQAFASCRDRPSRRPARSSQPARVLLVVAAVLLQVAAVARDPGGRELVERVVTELRAEEGPIIVSSWSPRAPPMLSMTSANVAAS